MVTSALQPALRAAGLFQNTVGNPLPKNRLEKTPRDTMTHILSFLESPEKNNLNVATSRKDGASTRFITKVEIAVSIKIQMKSSRRATWKDLQRYRQLKGNDFSSGEILELDLADSNVSEDQLKDLLARFPNIQTLSLARCRGIKVKTLTEFLQKRRKESLQDLIHLCHGSADEKFRTAAALTEEKKRADDALIDLCSKNLALKELAEKGNIPFLIARALESPNDVIKRSAARAQIALGAVDALVQLCSSSDDSAMILLARNYRGFENLNLAHTSINDGEVLSLLPYCSNLLSLDLSGCYSITDITLKTVAKYCRGLLVLILYECRQISDSGLRAIAQKCLALHTLNLTSCRKITDTGLEVVTLWCQNLHTLDLSWCSRISERGFQSIAQNCPKLHTFTLMGCRKITDDNVQGIAQKCPDLLSFNLIGCRQITDAGIQPIAHNCKALQTLKLISCSRITDTSIRSFARCCPNLQAVDLSNCTEVTDWGLMELAEKCPHIRSLHVLGCHRLTYAIIETFFNKCPYLQEIFSPKGQCIQRHDHQNSPRSKRAPNTNSYQILIHVLATCILGVIASYTIAWQAASSLSLLYLGRKYYHARPSQSLDGSF